MGRTWWHAWNQRAICLEFLIGPEGKRLLVRAELMWQDNIKKVLQKQK
jgi:hypothetical protein